MCACSGQWFLPNELQQCIAALPIPQPALAMCTHVLIAKARICIQLQVSLLSRLFYTTLELLTVAVVQSEQTKISV